MSIGYVVTELFEPGDGGDSTVKCLGIFSNHGDAFTFRETKVKEMCKKYDIDFDTHNYDYVISKYTDNCYTYDIHGVKVNGIVSDEDIIHLITMEDYNNVLKENFSDDEVNLINKHFTYDSIQSILSHKLDVVDNEYVLKQIIDEVLLESARQIEEKGVK